MYWSAHLEKLSRLFLALVPTGIRRIATRALLRRRFGLLSLGSDFDYNISENSSFGPGCRVGGPVYIAGSSIGAFTYIEVGCRISASTLGHYCSVAPYALIGLAEHPSRNFVSTHPRFYRSLPQFGWDLLEEDRHSEMTRTVIGNDVWIGAGACIKGGVTIGDGAIIGAGAVVTSDIEPYAIYGGVPAKLIRYRFEPETIAFLMELRWWEKDEAWLRRHVDDFKDVSKLRDNLSG